MLISGQHAHSVDSLVQCKGFLTMMLDSIKESIDLRTQTVTEGVEDPEDGDSDAPEAGLQTCMRLCRIVDDLLPVLHTHTHTHTHTHISLLRHGVKKSA